MRLAHGNVLRGGSSRTQLQGDVWDRSCPGRAVPGQLRAQERGWPPPTRHTLTQSRDCEIFEGSMGVHVRGPGFGDGVLATAPKT